MGRTAQTLGVLSLVGLLITTGQAAIATSWHAVSSLSVQTGGSNRQEAASASLLEIRSSAREGTSEGYLRFDLSDCVPILDKARLRLYARLAEPGLARLIVRSVASSNWNDHTLTWANKPAQDVSLGEIEIVGISAAWYDLDITPYVRAEQSAGRRLVSLALVLGGAFENRVLINGRQAPDHPPELLGNRPPLNLKISFLPATSTASDGYLPDHGQVFGPRGQGLHYGWDVDNTTLMRDRAHPASPAEKAVKGTDRLGETFAYMEHQKRSQSARWEVAVPNSTYRVRLKAGDPQSYDSVYAIEAEDVLVVDGVPEKDRRWIEGVKEVKVRDGRLTVASNLYASKNRINFIEISEVAPPTN